MCFGNGSGSGLKRRLHETVLADVNLVAGYLDNQIQGFRKKGYNPWDNF